MQNLFPKFKKLAQDLLYILIEIIPAQIVNENAWEDPSTGQRRVDMRKLILASHGSLAEGLKSAAAMILGDAINISAYGLDTWVTPKSIFDEVRKELDRAPDTEFIILCDIKGGSVHNCMMELLVRPDVSIFTGMNLTMVLEVAVLDENIAIRDESETVMESSRNNICYFNRQMISKMMKEEGEDELW